MTFLNLALLGGVLAFNIPLIIHLLNKSRHQKVDWAAMFLLEQVVRQNRKRVRLEQIIMLLVRCAIPVLLALAMAQPILSGLQKLVGSSPGSVVVMLDSSYSMQARDGGVGSLSRLDLAREKTQAVLNAQPDASQGQVIRVGGGFDPVNKTMSPELDRIGNTLDTVKADRALADGPAALRHGATLLQDAKTLKRDLVLVSDFQRVSWAGDSAMQRDRLKQLIDALPTRPAVVLMPVAGKAGRNLSVTAVTLSSRAVGVGQRVRITATVLNTSDDEAPDTPVILRIDGVEQQTQRITLAPGESADLVYFHSFDKGGPHTLEVMLTDGILAADDTYRLAVNVIESLPVLLVNGDRSADQALLPFPENETDFLELALEPFSASADAPLADLIDTTTIGPSELGSDALEGQRVAVLANVQALNKTQVEALRTFVEAGGALLVFPGDRVDVAGFNKDLHHNGDDGLLPAAIAGLTGKALGYESGATLLDERHEHPALALWNDPANGSLAGVSFDAWYELRPDLDAQVIARLSTGHPLLVRREIGQGVVIVGAVPVDTAWGNLPTTPVFLPLMQRLIAFAATHAEPQSNVSAGRPITALMHEDPGTDRLTWQRPDGKRVSRPVEEEGGRWRCTLDDTATPGVYRLLVDDVAERAFAVNLPREESDLRCLNDEELEALAESIGATVVRDGQAYAEQDRERRHGRPTWRLMWLFALVLVFGELLLQQWFGKGGGA